MEYSVVLSDKAENFLKKADKTQQTRIREKLRELKTNPKIGKPLKSNLTGLWSFRVGDWRIIYQIKDKELLVFVIRIGHRKNVYE